MEAAAPETNPHPAILHEPLDNALEIIEVKTLAATGCR
jgi:hypothetical protein